MERFMIGQFGRYSSDKHKRDFRQNFFGVEACMMEEDDIKKLMDNAINENFNIGVHLPLRKNSWRLRDPQFLSKNSDIKRSSYEYMDSEIEFLKQIKPRYILLYYPKPVLLDKSTSRINWRFVDDTEYYIENDYPYEIFSSNSKELFKWLTDISIKNDFIPVLELDLLNKYIYDTSLLETLLDRYPRIKLCLDIGRLHLQDKLDNNFDSFKFTTRFAKYAEVIHLWNVKVTNTVEYRHFPVLPTLKVEEGWADVEKYLNIIKRENKLCEIFFEHKSDLITDEELESCYSWISSIL